MNNLKVLINTAAITVLLICVYSFLVGNKVFKGEFDNDPIGWYFLAKGIFCSLSLYLSVRILEVLSKK
ncbi:MAG: hypothetical protein A2W23_02915 [Planctomycetes bacterium RBG_16_43_13]|nr:MAG: hypothetical protein A2W23_02915 [Planctomycetes bacterium RBG_16_43_13]